MSNPFSTTGSQQGRKTCDPLVEGRESQFHLHKQRLRSGTRLACYVASGVLVLAGGSQVAKAQSVCPTQIAGAPLVNPIVIDTGTTSPPLNLGDKSDIRVLPDAFITSSLSALDLSLQTGAYAIEGAGSNRIIICGTIGTSSAPPALAGGGVRAGLDSDILVTNGGLILGTRGGSAIAPGVDLLGAGSSVTVDAGGQILGGFAPSIRGNAPVTVTNAGSIVVSGAGGFETSAIDLTGGVGSTITNSGTITSGSAAAIQFRNARGVVDGVSRITNSGTIVGTGGFFARSGGISLRRGLIEIANTGQIQNIQVGINADADGFAPQSGLTLFNQAGNIGMINITASSQDFRPDLPYDLDLTNAAGATIGFIPGIELSTGVPLGESLVGISTLAAGRNHISNAGLIQGTFNGIRFASGDTIITNLAGATIRNPDQAIFFPAANEGYAIYGEGSITADVARPLIDNSGTIFGAFGGVNTRLGDATVINRSIRDASGTVIGGGSIGGGASGVTIGGGSIINEAGATISANNVRSPGLSGCIELRESFGVTCTELRSAVFFTNTGLVGSLDNRGTITSQSQITLLSFSPLSLFNGPTGVIENLGTSFGAVEARNGLAADFVNEGVIRSSGAVVQITGTSDQSLGGAIINRGSIIGVNGATALLTFGGSAQIINELGARVEGVISLSGVQNIPNGAGTSPTSGSVINSGTVTNFIDFVNGGDLVNQATGSITSGASDFGAVNALRNFNPLDSFFNVTNSGVISGVGRGIYSEASRAQVTITNLTGGSITANDPSNRSGRGDGINVRGTLTLTNQVGASIAGSRGGVTARSAIDFFNAGTISGGQFGVDISNLLVSSSGQAIFRNSGSITTTQLFGVHAFIENASRFENSGTISGGSAGLQVVGSPTRSVEISNSGQIASSSGNAVNLVGGSLTALQNSGSIIASQNGLDLQNIADATIINQTGGLIDTTSAGSGWAGLAVFNGSGVIINEAGATISASAGTNEGGESAIFIGSEAGSVRVENDGVLSGVFTFSASNATDLVNRGSILATQVTDGDAINILLGGVFRNEAGANVTATRDAIFVFDDADNGTITEVHNAEGATITGDADGNGTGHAIFADDGGQSVSGIERVSNAGAIVGDIFLGLNDDRLELASTGTITGDTSGGEGVDALRIDTATGSTRTLAEGQFAQFEDIVLNPTTGAAGRYVLTAAADPAATATLDAGSTGSLLTLARGELNLRDSASSLRATTVSTAAGTLLSGNGTIFGDTSVAGTIAPGNSVGHLTIDGNLSLTATSLLDFELGEANVVGGPLNDLITVNGALVLDGLLTVKQSAGGSFTPGVYRLIDYQGGLGALTDYGLDLGGLLPNGLSGVVQTSIGNQVNLVIAGVGVDISYWDGTNFSANGLVDGGPGVWNSSNTNFTLADGSANAPWDNDIGVFAGPAGGVVSVEGVQGFTGLQFVTDRYRIVRGETGAGLTLGTGGFIFVDSGIDARFDLGIAGSGGLNKQGNGRLILTEANGYGGGTVVNGGTLSVGHVLALGLGGLQLANGTTLQAFAPGLNLANAVSLVGSGAVVATVDTQAFDLTLSGQLAGDGRLVKAGIGALSIATGGQLAGVDVTGGRLNLVGTASLDLQSSLTLADATQLNLAQGTVLNAGLLGVLGDAGRQTITSAGTINGAVALGDGADTIDLAGTISGRIDLGAGDDTLTLRNSGSIGPSASGGAGTDQLVFDVNIGATRAIDGRAFADFEDIDKTAGGTLRVATGTLAGQTLRVGEGALELAGGSAVTLSGGASLVGTTRLDVASGASLSAASIGGDAASQTITNAGTINGAVALGDGADAIDLVGRVNGTIDLGAGDDGLILRASGAVTAAAQGGSGTDTLAINTAASADRTIDDGIFIGFEDIALNADADALGRFVLTAASDPQGRATLDAGTGSTSTIRLARGELNLRDVASSLRAASLDIGSTALLSGVGSVYTGVGSTPSGRLNVAGTISPGNAVGSIGSLQIVGGYQQSGTYVVDYRAPADLTNIVNGVLLGRNSLNTAGLAPGAQDADLLVINGAGTLTGGSVLLRPQGSTAQFAAALTAPGNDRNEIRYQILHAGGGLGNTRLVALSAGNTTLEYPNANDVDLVIRGEAAPVLVVDGPPPVIVIERVVGDALGQQLATNLPRISYDCDVPISGAASTTSKLCLFGQVTRGLGSLPNATVGDARAASFTPDSLYTGFLHRISTNWRLGLGIGHSTTNQQLDGVNGSEVEGTALALMVRREAGPARIRATVGGGFYRAAYSRASLFGDGRSLAGDFDASFVNGTVEAERWFNAGKRLSFAPRAGVDWRLEWRDAFVETGNALDRFSARSENVVRARTSLGGVARMGFKLGSIPAFVEPTIAWNHEIGDVVTSVAGQYIGRPNIAVQSGVRSLPRDSVQFSVGGAVEVSRQTTLRFQCDRIDNAGRASQSVALRLSVSF